MLASQSVVRDQAQCIHRATGPRILELSLQKLFGFRFGYSAVLSGLFRGINPFNTKRRLLYLKTQFVPRSTRFSSRL